MRQAAHRIINEDPHKVRMELKTRLVAIIAEYAEEIGNRIRNSAFMAHPSLCPSFAYIHSFLNSKVFLNHLKTSSDYRMA
jgi:hypothetical protein